MANAGDLLPSGLQRDRQQVRGTLTGNLVNYSVTYPPSGTNLPLFLHQYGEAVIPGVEAVNERIAGYGAFCVYVLLADSHCGYELQDYKDAIDDVFVRYAERINTGNVTLAGESYGGAVVIGMAVRFPYLFAAVIPIFGIADFGYDEAQSWVPMVQQNSLSWDVLRNMNRSIGERATYRETRYLVRNAVLGIKNNRYAHFEILHDADDGCGRPGVQVEQSRRLVAALRENGNVRYTETPKAGLVYPQGDTHFAPGVWGQPIRYTHGFWDPGNQALHEFELNTLKTNMLGNAWKRPPFATTGELFIPSFLEVPHFRCDLGSPENNCDEAADLSYAVPSAAKYTFRIVPRTALTKGTLRLRQLSPNCQYGITCTLADTTTILAEHSVDTDAAGSLVFSIPATPRNSRLDIECVRLEETDIHP